jgi:hypothetical protein
LHSTLLWRRNAKGDSIAIHTSKLFDTSHIALQSVEMSQT